MTGLEGAALLRLEGGDPGFPDGLRIARNRAGMILGYSAIAATLGVLLSLLRGRQGQAGVGALVAGIGGLAWNVATFLVVPVLAAKGLGPVAAIKENSRLLRKTWGEQLTGTMGMGAAFAFRLTFAQAVTAKAHSASDGGGIVWTDVTIFCDGRQPAYAKQLVCRGRDAAFGGYLHDNRYSLLSRIGLRSSCGRTANTR